MNKKVLKGLSWLGTGSIAVLGLTLIAWCMLAN